MPQLYGTLLYNKLTLQGGHFYAPCGYENAMPTENFFYSHTYSFIYGEPTTLTGGFATYKLKDKLLVNAGLDTGWNEFSALNGKANAMFGFNWTSNDKDGKINVVEEVFIGNTQPAGHRQHPLPVQHGGQPEVRRQVALYLGAELRPRFRHAEYGDPWHWHSGGPGQRGLMDRLFELPALRHQRLLGRRPPLRVLRRPRRRRGDLRSVPHRSRSRVPSGTT